MFTTAANFIIALIESRPIAAKNILRDAGGARALEVNVQELQQRLESSLMRKVTEGQAELVNNILNDALRIEPDVVKDCDTAFKALCGLLLAELNENPVCVKIHEYAIQIAEEAFELGRHLVESIVEAHAVTFAEELEGMEKPKFLEINVL